MIFGFIMGLVSGVMLKKALEESDTLTRAQNRDWQKANAEIERLREALQTIIDGIPSVRAKPYRNDGLPSKCDKCPHDQYIYEACEECVSDFARAALDHKEDRWAGAEIAAQIEKTDSDFPQALEKKP